MSTSTFAELLAAALDPEPEQSWDTPGELAAALDPTNVQTPALDIIDAAIAQVSRGEIDRLIISMPPQEGKSTRTTRFGTLWMMLQHPEWRFALVSYADSIAEQFSYQIKTDIATFSGDDEGGLDLGLRLRPDSKAMGRWQLARSRGGVYAVGIGGSLTSKPVDALIIDDPVKDYRAADSTVRSEDAWMWYQSVARPRLAPGAPVILILTRWHEKDLAGRLLAKQAEDEAAGLENYDRWTVINIAAQADYDPATGATDVLGREPGEFMRSSRGRTQEQWEATKNATSPRIWSAVYQGRPSPDTGDVWLRTWWRRYDTPLWSIQTDGSYRVEDDFKLLQSWDMTFKDTKDADFVVGQVWAQRGAEAYLLYQVRERMTFTATLTAFRRVTKMWPQATLKLVEDKANGTAVMDVLRTELGGIVPVTPHESKYARASAVAPFLEAGNILLPADAIALFDAGGLVEEAVAFPNGAHDDQVDATSQALARMYLSGKQGSAFLSAWQAKAEQEGKTISTTARDWRTRVPQKMGA